MPDPPALQPSSQPSTAPHTHLGCFSQHRNLPRPSETALGLTQAPQGQDTSSSLQGEGPWDAMHCPTTHHQALGLPPPLLLHCDFLGLQAPGTGCVIFRHQVAPSVISSDPALHASIPVVSSVVQGQAWGPQTWAGALLAPARLPQ